MSKEKFLKTRNEHLQIINQKFDELDSLLDDYLQDVRKMGGTMGFCIGGIKVKIHFYRERINDLCNKLPLNKQKSE